ncbi:MAG: hypothetical protein K2Q18_10015 [Bdellovibrionales bacterium]|nr:hypothetical protein [Bdellovibrionales bacterium]
MKNYFKLICIILSCFVVSLTHSEVRFRLLFNKGPFFSKAIHDFTCLNESSGQWFNCDLRPSDRPGEYIRTELAPGSYVMRLDVDDNRNNPKNYPGDYHADYRFQIKPNQENAIIDIPVSRFMHLVEPETNDGITSGALGDNCEKKPLFLQRGLPLDRNLNLKFRWYSIAPGATYRISIVRRKCDKYADLGIHTKFETTDLHSLISLPASAPDEYYALFLNGFKDENLIGDFFTYDEGMQSWSYGFRVERQASTEFLIIFSACLITLVIGLILIRSFKNKNLARMALIASFFGISFFVVSIEDELFPVKFISTKKIALSKASSVLVPKEKNNPFIPKFKFNEIIPRPSWWDSALANYEIHSYSELMQRWQSNGDDEASKRGLFRAIYVAIENYPSDEHLAVFGMDFLGYLSDELNIKLAIGETVHKHFFNFRQMTNNCANCSVGDEVASLLDSYSQALTSANRGEEALKILQELLEKREMEISRWKSVEIYMQIVKSYMLMGKLDLANEWMKMAYLKYPNTERNEQLKQLQDELSKISNK